jgi:hypothetical protein
MTQAFAWRVKEQRSGRLSVTRWWLRCLEKQMDKEKLKKFLNEMLEQADEVEAASGEIPTAQEAIGWIIDWLDEN